jgi:hypothetical protein
MNLCALTVQILPVTLISFLAVRLRAPSLQIDWRSAVPRDSELDRGSREHDEYATAFSAPGVPGVTGEADRFQSMDVSGPLCTAPGRHRECFWARIGSGCRNHVVEAERCSLKMVFRGSDSWNVSSVGGFRFLPNTCRQPVHNGATLGRFTGILGGQIVLSSALRVRTFARLFLFGDRHLLFLLEAGATILGLTLVLYSFRSASTEFKLFLFFAAGVLALALSHPIAGPDRDFPQWEYLQISGRSSRSYFFPILALYASAFRLAYLSGHKGVRYLAFAFLLMLPVGAYRD